MEKEIIVGAVIVGAALVGATVFVVRENSSRLNVEPVAVVQPQALPAPIVAPPPKPAPRPAVAVAATQPAVAEVPKASPPPAPIAARGNRNLVAPAAAPVDEPHAREALAWVGSDPTADAVWFQAINDPSLTPNERKDLIEDLNETGFDDPRNLTADDLPVIEYRISLIEQVAGQAMDDVNAAAFQEAYKDLVNMRQRVAGG